MTQGETLAAHLKRRALSYGDMQALHISTSPQKRVLEWLDRNPGWQLVKAKNAQGWTTWRVRRAK